MSWFIPYPQLDNEQLEFLENSEKERDRNYWLKGYAGSGKSVLLIHLLLKEKEHNPKSKVIIVLYTLALIDMIRSGIPEEYNNIPIVTYHQFYKMTDTWDLILVDEVQDLPEYIVRDIHSKGKRVIVAGDTNQSIYDEVCETDQISAILNGKSFTLDIIHRISRSIRKIAQFFCYDQNGFNGASMGRIVNLPPRLIKAQDKEEELKWLILSSKEYAKNHYAPAILIPRQFQIFDFFQQLLKFENKPLLPNHLDTSNSGDRRSKYRNINAHLRENGLKFQYLGNGAGSFKKAGEEDLVTVMTYHSAKGLDFKAVFIPFLSAELEIWKDSERAKTLFFVAVTRSREQLFLSYSGTKHHFLNQISENDFHILNASEEIERMEQPLKGTEEEPPTFVF